MSASIDHWLDEFGAELDPIYSRGRHVKAPRKAPGTGSKAKRGKPTGPATRESRRATLERIARKSPEVMVKITGGGRNMRQIKAHMDYISRNGLVELEDEQGLAYLGKKDVRSVRDTWRDGGHSIPSDGDDGPREAFNIMLSMPPGTPRDEVKAAVRAFAADEFQGFQYCFAAHNDEKHPHVHLTVKATALDGSRLNPRKGDLHRWRVKFAQELRDRGVDANASPRKARGVVRKAQRQALIRIAERGGQSRVARTQEDQANREAMGKGAHPNPAQDRISVTRKRVLLGYGQMAKALARGSANDRALAVSLVDLVRAMPAPTTAHEARVEAARAAIAERQGQREAARGREGQNRA